MKANGIQYMAGTHSGTSAQKVTALNGLGQIGQILPLKIGYLYQTRIWLHADSEMAATLLIWQVEASYTYYTQKKVTLSHYTALNPVGEAYAQLSSWLTGSRMLEIELDSAGVWIIKIIQASGNLAYILWHPEQIVNFSLPQNWGITTFHDLGSNSSNIEGNTHVSVSPHPEPRTHSNRFCARKPRL